MDIKYKVVILALLVAAIVFFNISSFQIGSIRFNNGNSPLGAVLGRAYFSSSDYETECLPDCSKRYDIVPLCHAECDGINGCSFSSERSKEVCTSLSPLNLFNPAVGSVEVYNATENLLVVCCSGNPYRKQLDKKIIRPELPTRNFVRTTRIVFLRGELVRMVVTTFR